MTELSLDLCGGPLLLPSARSDLPEPEVRSSKLAAPKGPRPLATAGTMIHPVALVVEVNHSSVVPGRNCSVTGGALCGLVAFA